MKQFSTGYILLFLLLTAAALGRAQAPQPPEPQGPPPTPGTTIQIQPPPLPPPPPEVLRQDEGTISIEPDGWLPQGHPVFNNGLQTTNNSGTFSNVKFQGKSKISLGGTARIPAGTHNAIRFTYFDTRASGNFAAPTYLNAWGTLYNPGDAVATDYRVRSVNVSFDYLTWPYPPASRRFRLKTLWQLQYVNVYSGFNAPLSTNSPNSSSGSKMIILPALGLGVTEYLSNNARVEANATGFDIPHHAAVGNADADIAYKFGHLELRAGGKLFYFKTSPQADFYMKGRLVGAFVGLRLYL